MKIENRIKFLSNLLNKYDINYINTKYKEIELGYAQENLNNIPHSEQMRKRVIAEAKRKSISKNRREYIQSLIDKNNNYQESLYSEEIEQQISNFFKINATKFKELTEIGCIYFEHNYSPKSIDALIFGNQAQGKYKNELLNLETAIDFSSIWGFIEERKFENMAESLEIIDIENQDYPSVFEELFKLRSYKLVMDIINSDSISKLISNLFITKDFYIEIGEHDNWHYEIFRN